MKKTITKVLTKETSLINGLIFLRLSFGIISLIYASLLWLSDVFRARFIDTPIYFKLKFFSWIQPLEESGINIVFFLIIIASILVTIGYFYKISLWILFFLNSYTFLLTPIFFSTDFYFISIFNLILLILPCNKNYSLDVLRSNSIKRRMYIKKWYYNLLFILIKIVFIIQVIAFFKNIFPITPTVKADDVLLLPKTTFNLVIGIITVLICFSVSFLIFQRKLKFLLLVQALQFFYLFFSNNIFSLALVFLVCISLYNRKIQIRMLSYLKKNLPMKIYFKPLISRFKKVNDDIYVSNKIYFKFLVYVLILFFIVGFEIYPYMIKENKYWNNFGIGAIHNNLFLRQNAKKSLYIQQNDIEEKNKIILEDFLDSQRIKLLTNQFGYYIQLSKYLEQYFEKEGVYKSKILIESDLTIYNTNSSHKILIDTIDINNTKTPKELARKMKLINKQ